MDRRWLGWPQELKVEHWPLSHSPLIHYQLPQPREVSLFYIRGGGFCFKTPHAHARFLADIMRRSLADCYVPIIVWRRSTRFRQPVMMCWKLIG